MPTVFSFCKSQFEKNDEAIVLTVDKTEKGILIF